MATKLTLSYFSIAGRAEPIRIACAIGKVPFTHKVIPFPQFGKMKRSLPLGQLPVLEIAEEGKETLMLPQTPAILRYVGKLGGLYPSDPVDAAKVDSIMDTLFDMYAPLDVSSRGMVRSHISEEEFTEDEKKAMRLRIVEKHFPKYLGRLETLAKDEGGFMAGGNVTIADTYLFGFDQAFKSGMMEHIPSELINDYPTLRSILDKVGGLPEVKAWYENHPLPYDNFDFTP